MNALDNRKYVITTIVNPLLKKYGFKRKANSFIKTTSLDSRIIDLNSSKFNDRDCVRFGISIGFFSNAVFNFFTSHSKTQPEFGYCLFSFSLREFLEKDFAYYQYEMESGADIDYLANSIYDDLCDALEKLSKIQKPIDYLTLINPSNRDNQIIMIYTLILLLELQDISSAKRMHKEILISFDGHQEVKEKLIKLGIQNGL